MACYGGFAYFYDLLMKGVPYETWVTYIDRILKQHLGENPKGRIVLDLACGTGNITLPLAQMGYDMIGVDLSADMLAQAQAKIADEQILFLSQDMRQLDLYGTVDAAVCACDGLNYILDVSELADVFKRVKMFLNPGGVFIFDMNTIYKFTEMLGSKSFVAEAEGVAYELDNRFDAETGINEYQVVFMPCDSKPFIEVHHQRAYPVEDVCDLLRQAGFTAVDVHDGYNDAILQDNSTRVVYIAS